MTGIDSAIAAATQAAANIPQENTNATGTAIAPAQQTAAALPTAGTPMGLADAMAGTQIVDHWLKVSEHGLSIDGLKPVFEEIEVEIDMSEIGYSESIKYGNPAQYEKTYDRVLAASGKTWAQAVADATKVDPKARPYKSADLSMTMVNDQKFKDKTIEAGAVLGHSLSTTGFKAFARFIKALQKADVNPSTATVKVKIGYSEQSSNGNTWGILDFRDFEVVG